jgi:cell division transport system permease protein
VLERPVYMLRRAFRNISQSPFLCAAAVATVAVSLTLLGFFAIMVVNVQLMTGEWSQEVQVIAYLEEVPQERSLKGLIDEVGRNSAVEGVVFVSSQQAYDRFAKRLQQDADLLSGLEPGFLPASLEITLREEFRTREGVSTLVSALNQNPLLSDLRYGQEWLERFEAFVRLLKVAGVILGGFLLFAALFIVANTIKLTLYARRDELEIMALVGATPLFIKLPFLLEGALQGAAGGVLALGGTFLLFHLFLQEGMTALLLATGTSHVVFLPGIYQLAILAGGALLGFFGSLFSLRKFVRL